uniref:Uncharacterized protein n=1 Tax=Scylla paramamosain TaxID=85552 RepID=D2DT52_SCYPA|nr:hypothetical protein [Scylla paramamosain]
MKSLPPPKKYLCEKVMCVCVCVCVLYFFIISYHFCHYFGVYFGWNTA